MYASLIENYRDYLEAQDLGKFKSADSEDFNCLMNRCNGGTLSGPVDFLDTQVRLGGSDKSINLAFQLTMSMYMTHLESFKNLFVTLRLELWPLMVLMNLFRSCEHRISALSAFDPVIILVSNLGGQIIFSIMQLRDLCDADATDLPFSETHISEIKKLCDGNPDDTSQCLVSMGWATFKIQPAFLFR